MLNIYLQQMGSNDSTLHNIKYIYMDEEAGGTVDEHDSCLHVIHKTNTSGEGRRHSEGKKKVFPARRVFFCSYNNCKTRKILLTPESVGL